jgi:hypothetical protein
MSTCFCSIFFKAFANYVSCVLRPAEFSNLRAGLPTKARQDQQC